MITTVLQYGKILSIDYVLMHYVHVNNFSVMPGDFLVILGWTDKVSCSRTQHSASSESRTRDLLIPSLTLYQLSRWAPPWVRVIQKVFGLQLRVTTLCQWKRYQVEHLTVPPSSSQRDAHFFLQGLGRDANPKRRSSGIWNTLFRNLSP